MEIISMDLGQVVESSSTTSQKQPEFFRDSKSKIPYYKRIIQSNTSKRCLSSTPKKSKTPRSPTELVCMNCYSYVNINSVDKHSIHCTKPLSSEDVNEISLINLRICKLIDSVKRTEIFSKRSRTLIQIAESSLNTTDPADCFSVLEEIISRERNIDIKIYARHLAYLLELKKVFISEKERLKPLTPEELSKWFVRVHHLMGLIKTSSKDHLLQTPSSSNPNDNEMDDLEQYFYHLCLKRKAELSRNHPKQNLLISQAYEQVKSTGVRLSQWENFVRMIYN